MSHAYGYGVDGDELAALAVAMSDDYGPLAYLGAVLGLRWGECAGLEVGQLDVLRSTLTVAWQRTRGPGASWSKDRPSHTPADAPSPSLRR